MIKNIVFKNDGFFHCKSNFYSSGVTINPSTIYEFKPGINKLIGEIDSEVWIPSYLFSMYGIDARSIQLVEKPIVRVNEEEILLSDFAKRCCYLDHIYYPLFSSKRKTVYQLIKSGLRKTKNSHNADEICNMFLLDSERIHRPVCCVGNERFRAMAAIGYAYGKEVFCFPWLSKKMFDYYNNNILWLLDLLDKLNVIVILPIGK